jgi:hypothetical protein
MTMTRSDNFFADRGKEYLRPSMCLNESLYPLDGACSKLEM